MNQVTKAADLDSEELGRWVGRREAFAAVAGKCSAAEAESLRRIREDKLYRKLGMTWEEFCKTRLGSSRSHVEKTIRLLDEFGPAYFHVAQMAHVSPDEYRAIAAHVGEDGVRVDGAIIALLPENSEQVSAAVAGLVKREKPAAAPSAPAPFDTVMKRFAALSESVLALRDLSEREVGLLMVAVTDLMNCAEARGATLPEW